MNKPTLAAVLIVKNEAETCAPCLASLDGLVDEIVIMDSGSQDETPAIAAEFGARFFVNPVWPGFGRQRRLAQSHVQSDWVLWLDADERLTPELKAAIAAVMANPASDTIYSIRASPGYSAVSSATAAGIPDRVLRLYPKALTSYNEVLVHEKVEVRANMKIVNLRQPAPLHLSGSGHYLVKSAGYARAWADQRTARGRRAPSARGWCTRWAVSSRCTCSRLASSTASRGSCWPSCRPSTFVKYADLWIRQQPQAPDQADK